MIGVLFSIHAFLRLIKENTRSTRYTSEVRIHIDANPPYAGLLSPSPKSGTVAMSCVKAAVFAPMLRYKINPQIANKAS